MNKQIIYKNLSPKNISIFITILIFCFYIIPFILLRDESYIHVHDNLDSVFLYCHHLANSGYVFTFNSDILFKNVMNGLPIYCLPSVSFTVLIFYLFGSLAGYIINDIIVHLVAFIGMYLLLKKYFFINSKNQYIVIALSLCFALVPFESIYGISVSGQPLLLYTFLNIFNKNQKIQDYILILFFPFYSFLPLAGFFIIFALFIILIAYIIKNKNFNYRLFVWIFIIVFLYCIVEYKLFYANFFTKDFISHRVEMDLTTFGGINFVSSIKKTVYLFFKNQYHSGSFKTYAVILAFITAFIVTWRKNRLKPILFWLPLIIVMICLIHGFYRFWIWSVGFGNFIPFLKRFQGDRFYFLLPFLWFLLFAVSLNELSKSKKFNCIIYGLLIFQLILIGIENKEYQYNFRQLITKISAPEAEKILPNFKQFFAENLFSQIKNYINTPLENYRVVSIGMHPSIAQYNGLYTLDSYQNVYPLKYKHKFRQIIANELEKNERLKNYFDAWGSRCYVFVAGLRDKCYVSCYKNRNCSIDDLEINTKPLKELGGKYIISAVSINNYNKLNLSFEKLFQDKDACWKIYLYKVN